MFFLHSPFDCSDLILVKKGWSFRLPPARILSAATLLLALGLKEPFFILSAVNELNPLETFLDTSPFRQGNPNRPRYSSKEISCTI